MKAIARELKIPVIALSQLSRDIEKRGGKPKLSDLRDSGAIEQDADVVMFIHQDDNTKTHGAQMDDKEIIIAKHRNGPTGIIHLGFDKRKMIFTETENKYRGSQVPEESMQDNSSQFLE